MAELLHNGPRLGYKLSEDGKMLVQQDSCESLLRRERMLSLKERAGGTRAGNQGLCWGEQPRLWGSGKRHGEGKEVPRTEVRGKLGKSWNLRDKVGVFQRVDLMLLSTRRG